jgi:hypothetical protein
MIGWAKSNFGDHRDGFDTLHAGLTVGLISTSRADLKVCSAEDPIVDVIKGNIEKYDYLPVVRSKDDRKITGLFRTKELPVDASLVGTVAQNFTPLSEETIIGADSSILDFILDADQKPCRLVFLEPTSSASLACRIRLPVRAALFALITGFEITMMSAIRKWYGDVWMSNLSDERRRILEEQRSISLAKDGLIDSLLLTQFCDKKQLVFKRYQGQRSKSSLKSVLSKIERLRDFVAHANDYAASPEQAAEVCTVVRNLIELRGEISTSVVGAA